MRPAARFFLKLFILALPLGILLATYVFYDPFMVLRAYRDYNTDHGVDLNRDFVSTQVYLNQARAQNYDSFIFGSSRSQAFMTEDWTQHIDSKAAFHFDAWFETLYGVAGKFRLLEREGAPIRHALVVVDSNLLAGTDDREGPVHMKHPAASRRYFAFHALYLKTYLSHKFLFPFLAGKILGGAWSDAAERAKRPKYIITPVGNDLIRVDLDARIAANEDAYYASMASVFGNPRARVETVDKPAIGKESLECLREIHAICVRHNTDMRIVISPLYEQARINPADLKILNDMFGAKNVNDFSGVNEFTANVRNYYETSHYRPHVGRELLKRIYAH